LVGRIEPWLPELSGDIYTCQNGSAVKSVTFDDIKLNEGTKGGNQNAKKTDLKGTLCS
jgi:hypothetical protein